MINSRKVSDLRPAVRKKAAQWQHILKEDYNIDVLIYCTYRDEEQQDALYARGRDGKGGRKVTNAKGGQSWHQYRVAYDAVPMLGGKAMWNDTKSYNIMGKVAEFLGMEWAGRWESFKETAHFQYTKGHTMQHFKDGGTL